MRMQGRRFSVDPSGNAWIATRAMPLLIAGVAVGLRAHNVTQVKGAVARGDELSRAARVVD
jgi:hypothetical protein